ncbi:hypothetical protein ACGFR6_04295 [Streptomyces sp. NPDC048567]|uniref:hypothetical protein n=1 Tax=Streptomyces sp. NPDC048567 TaxID=3365570 RepID=UPI00371A582A
MSERDPLVLAALSGPLRDHGGKRQAEQASSLTAQTLRRIMSRDDIPLLAVDHFDTVDWDEYADYLETLGTAIRRQLAGLPGAAEGRAFTADDMRAETLLDLARRVRETELTDLAYWRLTLRLRHEAEGGPGSEFAGAQAANAATRAEWARTLTEVADQITAFRTHGPGALDRLDADMLARTRTEGAVARACAEPEPAEVAGHAAPEPPR